MQEYTIFLEACKFNDINKVKELLAQGFNDLNCNNNEALLYAINNKSRELLDLLLKNTAVLQTEIDNNFTHVRIALENKNIFAHYIFRAVQKVDINAGDLALVNAITKLLQTIAKNKRIEEEREKLNEAMRAEISKTAWLQKERKQKPNSVRLRQESKENDSYETDHQMDSKRVSVIFSSPFASAFDNESNCLKIRLFNKCFGY